MKIKPVGSKLIILQKEKTNFKTEGGLEVVENELREGVVVEVSDEFGKLYKKGDIVLFPDGSGISEFYNGQYCRWIDGRSVATGGEIWGIIPEEDTDRNIDSL